MATSITNTSISTDTINVDNGVLYVDNNNNRVGIGTTTPNTSLHISAGSSVGSLTNAFEITDSGYTNIQMLSGGADGEIKIGAAGQLRGSYKAQYAGTGGAYNFNIGTNSTNAITIDTNQYVGIGITTPAQLLHVQAGSSGNGVIRLGGGAGLEISHDNAGNTLQRIDSLYRTTSNNTNLQLRTGILTFHTGTSSTERMRIDSNGQVTTPYQPGFRAVLQSDWNSITTTPQKITGFSIAGYGSYQVGNNFSSDRFTAPAAGQYHFSITSLFNQSQGYWSRLYFRKNGSTIAEFLRGHSYSSQWHEVAGSALIFLNTGDYIEVYADAEAGANFVYNSYTQWHGVLLG